jgi:hypothetical protein
MKRKVYIAIENDDYVAPYGATYAYLSREQAEKRRDFEGHNWPVYELTIDVPDPPESEEHKAWREAREEALTVVYRGNTFDTSPRTGGRNAHDFMAGWDLARPEPK